MEFLPLPRAGGSQRYQPPPATTSSPAGGDGASGLLTGKGFFCGKITWHRLASSPGRGTSTEPKAACGCRSTWALPDPHQRGHTNEALLPQLQPYVDRLLCTVRLLRAHCQHYRSPARGIVILQEICNLLVEMVEPQHAATTAASRHPAVGWLPGGVTGDGHGVLKRCPSQGTSKVPVQSWRGSGPRRGLQEFTRQPRTPRGGGGQEEPLVVLSADSLCLYVLDSKLPEP